MKYKFFLLSLITKTLLAGDVLADTVDTFASPKNLSWFSSIRADLLWTRGGESQTFFLTPEIEKTYASRKESNKLVSGEIFIGMQKLLSQQLISHIGLAATITDNTKLQGVIWDDTDPQFDNYSYQYKIKHSGIIVKGILFFDKGYWLLPWISGGIGVGFNKAHNFTNTPLIYEAIPNPNFRDHTQTALTYTLGAGVQKKLNQHWQVGLGYEFSDWGKSKLNRATDQTINSGLSLNHLYTNGLLLNITYLT